MVKKSIKKLDYAEYASDDNNFEVDLSYIENKKVPKNILKNIRKNISNVNFYKYSQDKELINLISKSINIDPSYLLLTSGCDGALHNIAETFLEKNDKVIIPVPSFPRYEFHTKVMESEPYYIEFSKFPYEFNLDLILKKAQEVKPKLIFLANPNNPTGHFIPKKQIEKFIAKTNSFVVLDEALAEYTGISCVDLVKKYSNLIVTRSFSKIYGLAGLRIGYLVAKPSLKKEIEKTVSPFELSVLSIEAIKTVFKDKDFVKNTIRNTKLGINFINNSLKINHTNSSGSVVLICGSSKGKKLYSYLSENGIGVINGDHFRGLENKNCVRVAVGPEIHLKKLVDVLNKLND